MAEQDSKQKAASSKTAPAAKPKATPQQVVKNVHKEVATKNVSSARPAPSQKSVQVKPTAKEEKPKATPEQVVKNVNEQSSAKKGAAATATAAAAKPAVAASEKPKATPKATPEEVVKRVHDDTRKAHKAKPSGSGDAAEKAANPNMMKIIIVSVVAFVLLAGMILGIVLGVKSCGKTPLKPTLTPPAAVEEEEDDPIFDEGINYNYDVSKKATTVVGYSAEKLGTVERNIPAEVKDERNAFGSELAEPAFKNGRYPKYGSTLKGVIGGGEAQTAARQALVSEACYLAAWGTAGANRGGEQTPDKYTMMDEEGWLYQYKDGAWIHSLERAGVNEDGSVKYGEPRKLYKHSASTNMYLGSVSDDEQGIVKKVTMRARGYSGYGVTGIYAPPGEVIKIEISEADMNATGGLTIHIGQALYNGQANNIWVGKNQMQRIPIVLTTLVLNKNTTTLKDGVYTGYVGSFVGGPLYIRNTSVTFSATISGGVPYPHFILGYTTEEEYAENWKSSAPYYDLEVWNYGVLHSGPKAYAKAFSYEQIYNAAVLWEKVSAVTTTGSNQGIVFIYDAFVAAGAAVAFPGRRSVNCPLGWMKASLNYTGLVNSGSWGNFHEYHHNFQNFGVGYKGEVTNNALTLVSYSLFTRISAKRNMNSYGSSGLGGWNNYTSATWTLFRVNNGAITSTNGLAVYGTLLHNLGQDAFVKARGYNGASYFNRWATVTHQDFSYYAQKISAYSGDLSLTATDYPLFVPVASVYQTGRSYNYRENNGSYTKRYISTMQPYVIPYGNDFKVDLNPYTVNASGQYESGSVVIGSGFKYKIKSVDASKANGTLTETNQSGVYTFTPNSETRSGKIIVTLEITTSDGAKTWNGHELQDVDLVLEFEQTREKNKTVLERTTYTYAAGSAPTDAVDAFDQIQRGAGYTSKVTVDNKNPTQNSNTDVWYGAIGSAYEMPTNSVVEVKGKLYAEEEAKYRIALRGRHNVALFASVNDEEHYELVGHYVQTNTSAYTFPLTEGTYKDLELEAEDWVYFKAIMINKPTPSQGSAASFIGVGWGQFTPESGVYDEDDNLIDVMPETVTVGYATAYRSSYEFPTTFFESDYFYTRKYNISYTGEVVSALDGTTPTPYAAAGHNYVAWEKNQEIENLFDGKSDTSIHFSSKWGVSASKPAILAFDMGKEITANSMTLYKYTRNSVGGRAFPRTFTLEVSNDGENFIEAGRWSNLAVPSGNSSTVTFTNGNTYIFRYFRLTITATTQENGGRVGLDELSFEHTVRLAGDGDNLYSLDNDMFTFEGIWGGMQAASYFGHVYRGQKGSTVKFKFTGNRILILSSVDYGRNFEVYVDGNKVESVETMKSTGPTVYSYLSERLATGEHEVEIKCLGDANIDSIATFKEGELIRA